MKIGVTTLRNYAALCRSAQSPSTDPAQARAFDRMHRCVEDDPGPALEALIRVARAVSDDDEALGFLGADAPEDLFRVHADVLLDRLRQRRPEDEPLRVAAQTIWLHRQPAYEELRALLDLHEVSKDGSHASNRPDVARRGG